MTDSKVQKVELTTLDSEKRFYNYYNRPPSNPIVSDKPSKTQVSPFDAKSPQEVLQKYGMYKDETAYSKHPEAIYADLTQYQSYEDQLNASVRMKQHFNSLDPEVRARFNNDILQFAREASSPDFDVNKALTTEQQEKLKVYKDEEEAKKAYEAYLKSDEYKKVQEESAARMAYEQQRYEEGKKNYMSKK